MTLPPESPAAGGVGRQLLGLLPPRVLSTFCRSSAELKIAPGPLEAEGVEAPAGRGREEDGRHPRSSRQRAVPRAHPALQGQPAWLQQGGPHIRLPHLQASGTPTPRLLRPLLRKAEGLGQPAWPSLGPQRLPLRTQDSKRIRQGPALTERGEEAKDTRKLRRQAKGGLSRQGPLREQERTALLAGWGRAHRVRTTSVWERERYPS
ncbi:uncharacterized protein LOC110257362 [Sus scrofa]|uniref:uncharacterized protein LOC110257362 n=1 Tax=Sus scrofa TaxID=9823 RepID=UPI000A2B9306|nr:uncharacterized protein LOC110257362 [Sus scrofa]